MRAKAINFKKLCFFIILPIIIYFITEMTLSYKQDLSCYPLPKKIANPKNDIKNILLTVDGNYYKYTAVTMLSMLKNSKAFFSFHILGNLTEQQKKYIEAVKRYKDCEVIFYNPPKELLAPFLHLKFPKFNTTHLNHVVFYRVFAYKVLPENIKNIAYIDSDTLVVGDFARIYETNLKDNLFAAAENRDQSNKIRLNIPQEYRYINAGVMLINLKKMRETNFIEQCYEYAKAHPDIHLGEQDIINGLFYKQILLISYRYNIYSEERYKVTFFPKNEKDYLDSIKNPIVIHFVGSEKPWELLTFHKHKDLYQKYLAATELLAQEDYSWKVLLKDIVLQKRKVRSAACKEILAN